LLNFLFAAELRLLDSCWSIATLAAHDTVGIKLQNVKLLEGTSDVSGFRQMAVPLRHSGILWFNRKITCSIIIG